MVLLLLITTNVPTTTSFVPKFQSLSSSRQSSVTTTETTIPKSAVVFRNNCQSNIGREPVTTTTTTTQLYVFKSKEQEKPNDGTGLGTTATTAEPFLTEPGFLVAWIILVLYTFVFGPGEANGSGDTALIEAFVADPVHPKGLNELALLVFDLFGILPLFFSGLLIPNTRPLDTNNNNIGLRIVKSSVPYVMLTTIFAFYILGPFLAIRPKPYEDTKRVVPFEERSWITQNIIENKFFPYGIIAFLVYLPFGTNFVQTDFNTVVTGFIELIQTSRFISASSLDILFCHLTLSLYLLPIDYKLRKPDATSIEIYTIAAAATLLPYFGTAIYMATRPPIPSREQ